jgi:hypothetical protein
MMYCFVLLITPVGVVAIGVPSVGFALNYDNREVSANRLAETSP